jgi:uncharacterized protein (DUF1778 family)
LQGLRGDGARRIRTADLLGAMQAALSALPLVLMGRITDETSRVQGQRLSLRVEDGDRELFDRAADANRETLTQFLVAGGRGRAEHLLADRARFQLRLAVDESAR